MNVLKNFEVADLDIMQVLVGKKLNNIFKQWDMFIINFGDELEYTLHTGCFLRIKKGREIIMTYLDEYVYPSLEFIPKRVYKKDKFHEKSLLKHSIGRTKLLLENAVVSRVSISEIADVDIVFDNGVIIEIRPDCLYENNEYYRFFEYKDDTSLHYVVKTIGRLVIMEIVESDEYTGRLIEQNLLKKNKKLEKIIAKETDK